MKTLQPDFVAPTNSRTDGPNGLYKLPEHIETYCKDWLDYMNKASTIALRATLTERVRNLLVVQVSSPHVVPANSTPATTQPSGSEQPPHAHGLLAPQYNHALGSRNNPIISHTTTVNGSQFNKRNRGSMDYEDEMDGSELGLVPSKRAKRNA